MITPSEESVSRLVMRCCPKFIDHEGHEGPEVSPPRTYLASSAGQLVTNWSGAWISSSEWLTRTRFPSEETSKETPIPGEAAWNRCWGGLGSTSDPLTVIVDTQISSLKSL